MQEARLGGLRRAFARLGETGFPDDNGDEQSSQLHAELAQYDSYVAGRITTLLGGGRLSSSDLEIDGALRRQLTELASSSSSGAAAATRYLAYLDELDTLVITARTFLG
jgi:hypothetical protein